MIKAQKNTAEEIINLLENQISDLQVQLDNCKSQHADDHVISEKNSNFITNYNHELLTPLNSIMGLLELSLNTSLSPKVHDYLIQVQTSCLRIKNITDNVQTLTELNNHKLVLEQYSFNLHDLLEGLVADHIKKITSKSIGFDLIVEPHIPYELTGDQLLLKQIFNQLLDNAIKFSEKGKIIFSVNLVSKDLDGICLKFSIKDDGIGIVEKDIDNIFRAFFQSDSTSSRKYDGIGIGLSLCKQIIELMGGHLSVVSRPGEGSTFSFDLCFKQANQVALEKYKLAQNLLPCRVLIVDINKQSKYKSLYSLLNEFRADVVYLDSLSSFVRLFNNERKLSDKYHILIINLHSKDYECLEILSGLETLSSSIKTIALVPYNYTRQSEVYQQLHIDSYINKPITTPMFFRTINELCSSAKVKQNFSSEQINKSTKIKVVSQVQKVQLQQNLTRLAGFIKNGDPYQAEKLINELKNFLHDDNLNLLEQQINEFNFDEALKSLKNITRILENSLGLNE